MKFNFLKKAILYLTIISSCLMIPAVLWLYEISLIPLRVDTLIPAAMKSQSENTTIYAANGHKIGELFDKYQLPVKYKNIPPVFIQAITAIEDQNFFEHPGYDLKALFRAGLSVLKHRNYGQGGSTITQQLARQLFLAREKSIERKVKEIVLAYRIEKNFDKHQILELYVNSTFLGFGSYGIGAAAQRIFGRPLAKLNNAQLVLLAGLFQSPSRYNPVRYPGRAKRRQIQVINAMLKQKSLTIEQALALKKMPLNYIPYETLNEKIAPYFIDHVREEATRILDRSINSVGLQIYTTLDVNLQQLASASLRSPSAENAFFRASKHDANVNMEAALLTLNTKTGAIIAMQGGRSYERSQFNRTSKALRAPGSAFKPIIYSLALGRGRTWADVALVSPVSIEGYRPQNVGQNFLKETTLLQAFYRSLNTAAIDLGMQYSLQAVIDHAKKLGIESPLKKEAGTLLGSSEVSMLDMARLYSVFANGGQLIEPFAITRILDRNGKILYQHRSSSISVMDTNIASLMTEGLRAVLQYGTARAAADLSSHAAAKTGTTNDAVDNWLCGFTSNYISIVWAGDDQQRAASPGTSAATLALPIWADFNRKLIKEKKEPPLSTNPSLTSYSIHPGYGYQRRDGVTIYALPQQTPPPVRSDYQAVNSKGGLRPVYGH